MTLEEIRKFLAEHGLEVAPAVPPPAGTFADFMSWSGENSNGVQFLGGNFPEGITQIIANGCSAATVKFSDAFSACTSVDLTGSGVTNLIIPATTQNLTLIESGDGSPLTCTLPEGLLQLTVSGALYSGLPDLPATLQDLDIGNCPALGTVPALPAALQTLTCDNFIGATLPSLAGTQLSVLQAANTALVALPALPATLTQLSFDGSTSMAVPTIPAACTIINASNCNWDSAAVDSFLAQLVTLGTPNGNLTIDGTNDAPSAAGIASANTLTARGWVVTTN